jgi:hypothetical protein
VVHYLGNAAGCGGGAGGDFARDSKIVPFRPDGVAGVWRRDAHDDWFFTRAGELFAVGGNAQARSANERKDGKGWGAGGNSARRVRKLVAGFGSAYL